MTSTEIAVSTMAEQMEFARMVTAQPERGSQSLLPEAYRGNPANVLIATGLGQSMGLSYAESLYRISVIKGKPTAAAELISSNVRKAGHRLRVTDGDDTTTASIWRSDDPDFEWRVTRDLKWAREMGLAGNDNYKKQLLTMLQWRAISAVARLACPEALYGVVYVPGEVSDLGDESHSIDAQPTRRVSVEEITRPRSKATPKVDEPVDADVVDDTPQTDDAVAPPDSVEGVTPPLDAAASSDLIDPKGKQMKAIHAGMNEAGLGERVAGLQFLSEVTGREVESSKDLTKAEAGKVLNALAEINQGIFGDEPPVDES